MHIKLSISIQSMFGISTSHPNDTDAIKTAKKHGIIIDYMQVMFIDNSSGQFKEKYSDKQLSGFAKIKQNLIIHASHATKPWGNKHGYGKHLMKRELTMIGKVFNAGFSGTIGYILHLPDETKNILSMLKYINEKTAKLFVGYPLTIYLEIPSKKHYTPNELIEIYIEYTEYQRSVHRNLHSIDIGFCIDTAHLWATGVNIAKYDDAKKYIDQLNDLPIIFHLNDQVYEFNSKKDKHAKLFAGTMWKDIPIELSGVAAILETEKPVILERNKKEDLLSDYLILA